MKPPRYTIVEQKENGILIQHNRKPFFTAMVKYENGEYVAKTDTDNVADNQLKQMAKWYFFTHIHK